MTSAFLSLPGTVFVHNFFMKNTWFVNWGVEPAPTSVITTLATSKDICYVPSRVGLAFLIQSVRWRTKSKKKSPSGTEITLSAIFTNRLKPSLDRRFRRWEMFWQKSFARVDESTSKAY